MQSMMLRGCVMATVLGAFAAGGYAQTLQQRIDHMRQAQSRQMVEGRMERLNIEARLRDLVDPVDIVDARLRTAIQWFTATTGVPIVIDWRAMEQEGLDPEQRITIQMRHVPAGQLLGLMMRMAAPQDMPGAVELMYETTPWYVQIITKRQADRNLIVRVYDVGDLLMEVPNFSNAPEFDLNTALSNTNSGGSNQRGGGGMAGGGGVGGGGLFGQEAQAREEVKTRAERGEELAQLVRDTVEPQVWVENGGVATIRYHNNRLIVSAPRYVHAKIGVPVLSMDARTDAIVSTLSAYPPAQSRSGGSGVSNRSGVSGVQSTPGTRVSGVRN
jgi:uncharacterized membrane protein YgcG